MGPTPSLQASDHEIVASPADPSGPAPRRGTLDVLVIEGEADQCELIARCLEAPGRENIRIEFVHTVADGLRAVRANKYNCVLVSQTLPDGRGIDLLDEIDAENSRSVGERLCRLVQAKALPHQANTPHGCVTVSIGVAVFGADPSETTTDVLLRADQALYQAKAAGRNTVVVAPSDPGAKRLSA